MNTQIKRLLEQSGLQPYYNGQEVDIAKFADLLLMEVISTIYRSDISGRKQEQLVQELGNKFGLDK